MKLKILLPIITNIFNSSVETEAKQFISPDTEVEIQNLDRGTASIESTYDEALASPDIIEKVIQAEKDGFDGVFVDCFGDPAVDAAREMVSIPVVGGFQPAVLTACLLSSSWSVVTVLQSVVPMIRGLARKLGVESNISSVRYINTPVLELSDKVVLQKKLSNEIELAVKNDGAESVIIGCTGMLGLAADLEKISKEKGFHVPVIDPTGVAIGFLELLVRNRISHSKITYPVPTEKERNV